MTDLTNTAEIHRIAVENSADGMLAFDREFRYTLWNPAMERMAGMPAADVLGRVAWEVFPFLNEIGEDAHFRGAVNGETSVASLRPYHIPESGKYGYFEGYYSPLRDSSGRLIGGMAVIRDITERAHREAGEQLFRTIAESIPDIVWVTDDQFNVTYYNQRWYEFTGQPRSANPAKMPDYASLVHPDDLERLHAVGRESREKNVPFEAEYRLKSRSGEYRWFLGRAIAEHAEDGRVLRRIGSATDIHAQKVASEEIRASQEQFRTVVEQTPYAFQLYALDGLCTYANPAWESIWLSDREDVKTYNILQDPHLQKFGIHELILQAFRGERVTFPDVLYDPALNGKAGRPRWIRAHFFPIHDARGTLTQVAEVIEDVTANHLEHERNAFLSEASKLLGESLEVDRTLGNIAQLCANRIADFCIIDLLEPEGEIRRVEVAAAGDDSQTQELVTRMRGQILRLQEPDDPALIALVQQKTVHLPKFDEEWTWTAQISEERKKTIVSLQSLSLMSVPLIARGHSLGVMTVISTKRSRRVFGESEISWLEEIAERIAIAIDNANLYRSSKQAVIARDTFMSTASHELKTPLTALQLQLNLVGRLLAMTARDGEVTERVRSFQVQTDRQIRRLARLVDDMLDISRIASGKLRVEPESMDLTELTREVCERLQPLAGDYETQIQFTSDEPVFGEWDGHRIEQVLNNLLTNAFRYGGREPIVVRVWEEDESAFISVRDKGRGIAKGDQQRIFERYERGTQTQSPSGFGLGLYIAREIVTLHQGSIRVESEVGAGATFTIELPLHPEF